MKFSILKSVLAATMALAGTTAHAQLSPGGGSGSNKKYIVNINNPDRVDNRYLVVFKDSAVENASKASSSGTLSTKEISHLYTEDIAGVTNSNVVHAFTTTFYGTTIYNENQSAVEGLLNDSRIDRIYADVEIGISAIQHNATWGLDRIDQVHSQLNQQYQYDYTGDGVTIYVVDTGINNSHNELGGRVVFEKDFYTGSGDSGTCDDLPPDLCSRNITSPTGDTVIGDPHGHGSHVAGTIGASIHGVAKNVEFYNLRVLGPTGVGNATDLINTLNWISEQSRYPAVTNLSLYTLTYSDEMENAINAVVDNGVTVVAAAGNGHRHGCAHPASFTNTIAVGATQRDNDRLWVTTPGSVGSNYGACVDIFAPGKDIRSIHNLNTSLTVLKTGTSMATPHVTGAIALYLEANPSATPGQVKAALIGSGSAGQIQDPGTGSPNLIVNALAMSGAAPVITPDEFDDINFRGYTDNVVGDAVHWPGTSGGPDLHNFHEQGDVDWTIVAVTNRTIDIQAQMVGSSSQTRMSVYEWLSADQNPTDPDRFINVQQTLLGMDHTSGQARFTTSVLGETKIIAIKVTSFNNQSGENTEYQLNITDGFINDQYDDVPEQRSYSDDYPGDAVSWGAGDSWHFHNFHSASDQDWTFVWVPSDNQLEFRTEMLGTHSDTSIEVQKLTELRVNDAGPNRFFIDDMALMGSDDSPGNSSVIIDAEGGYLYAVKVTSRTGQSGSRTDYKLNIRHL